jgi:hypothetical protein
MLPPAFGLIQLFYAHAAFAGNIHRTGRIAYH